MMRNLTLMLLTFIILTSCKKDEGISPVLSFTVNARFVNAGPFEITPPVSESDGAITYKSDNPSVAAISGNMVTITGVGTATITASQASSNGYSAATTTAAFEVLPEGAPLRLGQWYQGGVVFYLNAIGGGLVVSDKDVAYAPWSSGKLAVVGTSNSRGSGLSNTDKIIASMGGEGNYAAWWARKYQGAGYSDWYLPSVEELALIRLRMDLIGGLKETNYWCSTEWTTPIGRAYFILFGPYIKDSGGLVYKFGEQSVWVNNTVKEKFSFAVRAVRSF